MDIEVWFVSYFDGNKMLFLQFPDVTSLAAWTVQIFPDPNVFNTVIEAGNIHFVKGVEGQAAPKAIQVVTQYSITIQNQENREDNKPQ